MILFIYYWLICGLATSYLPTRGAEKLAHPKLVMFWTYMFGGFIIPARILCKAAQKRFE